MGFGPLKSAKRGIALIFAIFTMVILGVLAAAFMVTSISEHQMSYNEEVATSEVQIADAGINWAYMWLDSRNDDDPPPQVQTSLGTYSFSNGGYTNPVIVPADTNDYSNPYAGWGYTIYAGGTTPDGRCGAVKMEGVTVGKESGACYMPLICGSFAAWYWDFDISQGPVFSNPQMWIYNSSSFPPKGARFFEVVKSASSSFRCGGYDEGGGCPDGYATFFQGYELNESPVDCSVDFSYAELCATSKGYNYDATTFASDQLYMRLDDAAGVATLLVPGEPAPWGTTGYNISTVDDSLVIYWAGSTADVHIWGTLRGRLTVMAGRDIYVESHSTWYGVGGLVPDLLYNADPRFGASDDALGLLAGKDNSGQGDFKIPDIDPGGMGVDGDRQIFAAFVSRASGSSIRVLNATGREREGMLIVYGSLLMGTLTATESSDGNHGYGTDWDDDPRLCTQPPPCFPPLKRSDGTVEWTVNKLSTDEGGGWQEVYGSEDNIVCP
jgi:hypothetical protein